MQTQDWELWIQTLLREWMDEQYVQYPGLKERVDEIIRRDTLFSQVGAG